MDTTTTQRKATVACQFCGRLNRVDLARAADRPKCGECGRPILLDRPLALSDASFDRVIADAPVPVLVDFYADWCGPCKMVAPFLDELATDMAGKVTVAKVNIDENPQTPRKYGVRGIPTMILFKGGQVAATKIGALPKSKLYEWVESAL